MIAKGRDTEKDQSYFLFTLTHDDLEFIRFPVGELTKKEVRKIAAEMNLHVAGKSESKDACFVPGDDYFPIVERYSGEKPRGGEIVLSNGRVVGIHEGVHRFTVGQRQGLKVALGRPMYVIRIDAGQGRIIIGGREECRSVGLVAREVIWNYPESPKDNMEVSVSIRYRTKPVKGRLFPLGGSQMKVVFSEDAPLVTPGQAAVFYRDDLLLGGGWIEGPIR
jgi:tRNA-specific 2-thiouridylase